MLKKIIYKSSPLGLVNWLKISSYLKTKWKYFNYLFLTQPSKISNTTWSFILFAFQGNDLLLTNNFNQEADIRETICSVCITNCWNAWNYFHSLKTQGILTTSNLIPIWRGVNVNGQGLKMLLFSNNLLKGWRKQYSFSNKTRFNKYSLWSI